MAQDATKNVAQDLVFGARAARATPPLCVGGGSLFVRTRLKYFVLRLGVRPADEGAGQALKSTQLRYEFSRKVLAPVLGTDDLGGVHDHHRLARPRRQRRVPGHPQGRSRALLSFASKDMRVPARAVSGGSHVFRSPVGAI